MKLSVSNKTTVFALLSFFLCLFLIPGCTLDTAKQIQAEIEEREESVRRLEQKLELIECVKNEIANQKKEIQKLEAKKVQMLKLHPELKQPIKYIKIK